MLPIVSLSLPSEPLLTLKSQSQWTTMRIQGKAVGGGGGSSYRLTAPAVVLAAIICTFLLTSHFEKKESSPLSQPPISYSTTSSNNLRQTTASSSSPFGVVIPQGRAVALPSVRISADESAKIDRNIYGGSGGKLRIHKMTKRTD